MPQNWKKATASERVAHRFAKLILAMSLPEAKKILGFPPSSNPTPEEVSKAYKSLALLNHPDRGGDVQRMVEINVAKDLLTGKGKATPQSQPNDRPQPKVKVNKGIDFNTAKMDAPHGVDWKFRSATMLGKETAYAKAGGLTTFIATWICYGQTASHHVFMRVEHAIPNSFAEVQFNEWSFGPVNTYPLTLPIEKVAPKGIKAICQEAGKLSEGGLKPALKYMVIEPPLTERTFEHHTTGVPLKDILIGAGLVSSATSTRKTVVEIVGKDNQGEYKKVREEAKAKGKTLMTSDSWKWTDFEVLINGKPYPLHQGTVAKLPSLFWLAVYGNVQYNMTRRRVLTRLPSSAHILQMLEGALSGESPELTVMLLRAIEEQEA